MYAIFENGSKQYKASVGDTVKVEKLDAEVGATVTFPVVMTADDNGNVKVGKELGDLKVAAEVTAVGKDKKIIVFKYKAKKNERKKQGHRQPYTTVRVTAIGDVKEAPKAPKAKPAPAPKAEVKVEEPAKAAAPKAAKPAASKAAAPKSTAAKPAASKSTAAKKPATTAAKSKAAAKTTAKKA